LLLHCVSALYTNHAQISKMKSSSFWQEGSRHQGGVYTSGGHVDLYIAAEQSERAE